MTELAASGVALFLICAVAVMSGFITSEMPFNYKALDTKRETAPFTFWAFAISWITFAGLGLAIAFRHWSG